MDERKNILAWTGGQEPLELTILTCEQGHTATKTFTPDGVQAFSAGWRYTIRGRAAIGIEGLHRLLGKLARHPQSFVIRGVPREGLDLSMTHRRRYRVEEGSDELVEFVPASQRWICVDVDTLVNPGATDERERAMELLCALPRCFASAGCVVQWSSSAGMDGWALLKAHLWFALDRPAYCKSWKAWWAGEIAAGRSAPIDLALYNPVQPHYTGSPIFERMSDPLAGQRLLLVPGPPVRVPSAVVDLEGWQEQERQREQDRISAARAEAARRALMPVWGRARGDERYAHGALRRACEAVASTPVGGRHDRLRDEAWALWRFVESNDLSEQEWRDALHSAGVASLGSEREDEVVSILNGCVARRGAA